MSCDCKNHHLHMCALKRQGLDDVITSLSDNPTVECSQCGAQANSSENLCAAHLRDTAPNVEGGHGTVGLEEIGKPHAGPAGEDADKSQIETIQLPVDGVCGGY